MASQVHDTTALAPLTHDDVVELVKDITDARAAAILATGATIEEFEEAVAWAFGESDVMGEQERKPLSGTVAKVYEILIAELGPDENEAPPPAA